MNAKNSKWILIASIFAIALFIIVFSSNVSQVQEYERASRFRFNTSDSCIMNDTPRALDHPGPFRPVPISYRMLLSPALLMVAAVFATYYFISRRLEEKLEKNMNLISKLIDNKKAAPKASIKKVDHNAILRFLSASERKIIESLIENKGTALQSEISRMEGMNKLKTHRAIKDLERKGIIKMQSHGKTNRIILDNDIKDALFS